MVFYRRGRQSKPQRTQRDSVEFCPHCFNDRMPSEAKFLCALCVKISALFVLKHRMAFYRRGRQSKPQRTQRDSVEFCPHCFNDRMPSEAKFLCALCVKTSYGFLPQSLAKYGAEERKEIQLSFVLIVLNARMELIKEQS